MKRIHYIILVLIIASMLTACGPEITKRNLEISLNRPQIT